MTGWVAGPQIQPAAASSGLVVAGMGRRPGALVIDATVVRLGPGLELTAGEYFGVAPPPQPTPSA